MTSFKRELAPKIIDQLKEEPLFVDQLKADCEKGEVFPAVRKGEIHFYYKGGCLYRFGGKKFSRDKEYDKPEYSEGTEGRGDYEKAKKQNENKFTSAKGEATERQILDGLNRHTFGPGQKTKTVVLDIEVRLNGNTGRGKKCDMVLLNTSTNQIMFVEGKLFSDERVKGSKPKVIEQVDTYTQAIAEQKQNIVDQYNNHIKIINDIFGTAYNPNISLIDTAKLFVFETPDPLNDNGRYSVEKITGTLGEKNVAWFVKGETPSIDEVWERLCQ